MLGKYTEGHDTAVHLQALKERERMDHSPELMDASVDAKRIYGFLDVQYSGLLRHHQAITMKLFYAWIRTVRVNGSMFDHAGSLAR